MVPSVDYENSIAILGHCMMCLAIFLMIASTPAAAQEITNVEGTEIIDTPTTTGGGITIDSAAIHPSSDTETIIVEFSNPEEIREDKVYLTNFTVGIMETQTASAEVKFEDLNIEQPGSYWIYYADGNFNDQLYPVTVPGYDFSTSNFPTEVTKDEKISFDLSISEKDLAHYDGETSDIEKIRVEAWKNDDSKTLYETSFSGLDADYKINSDVSNLDTNDYNLYVTALGSEKTVLNGQTAPEPLAAADLGRVSITDSEDDDGNDDNNDDVDNDDGNGEGSSGGGQGGGGAVGGQGTEGSTTDSGPPTPENVRDTLSLVDPADEATLNDDSSSTETDENEESDESQSSGNSESSVSAVEFEGETQHSVSVTDYGTPPQTVEEEVIDSIAAYNSGVNPVSDSDSVESTDSDSGTDESGSAADDGDSDVIEPQSSPSESSDGSGDTDDGSDIQVVSLSDISPTEEIGDEETSATVTFSVDRNEVTNPNQLSVYKEEYVFEAQEEQWIELETSVSETNEEEIEVTAETTEFSLFAVTETISEQSQPNGSNNETATSSQNNSTGTTDQTPGFGITSMILMILTVIGLLRHRT